MSENLSGYGEQEYNQEKRERKISNQFESIAKILRSKIKTEIIKAHTQTIGKDNQFRYRDMDVNQLIKAINEATIVPDSEPENKTTTFHLYSFAEYFGQTDLFVDEIIDSLMN